jgi:type IV secretory pathway TrbF-like protein
MKDNPYLQSKALWNELYGSVQTKLENCYRIILILILVIAVAMIGLVIVASETKVKPMPFVLHANGSITATSMDSNLLQQLKPKLSIYFAKQFIRTARSVSVDADVNQSHKIKAYSLVNNEAVQVLKSYYLKNEPDKIAQKTVVDIKNLTVLPESANTLVAHWTQNWRDIRSGTLVQSKHFIAQITYQYLKPSQNDTILQHNPLGFYITYLSWAQD